MSLVVETGSGLSTAEAYISASDFKTFCTNRGYRWEDYDDFQIEASLRMATGWIDTYSRYKGTRLLAAQALEFPREGLIDWSSYAVTGVPQRVKQACAELAFKGLTEPLYQDQDRGGEVISESVGGISVTYAAGAPTGKVWQFAVNLLKQYMRDPNQIGMPLWTEPAMASQFEIGMNDSPNTGLTSADLTE
ncbi:hypothetical protein UFOVP119_77 [uncultured Caudovirales phage]|uniref:Putative DnaT-like domain-containing protein n=1 Tax=uncultured Caudovirales phage TaxID=2100421 RepID=A0A6J5LAY7_9CAUD|nr:hypothetical protein UFOVP119_77 [uncultured Caudovirales phage]